MRRVALIAVAAVAACTLAGAWWVATTPPVPRHVIILSMDTTRADVLGAYGNPRAHTPHLDALAAEAVLFEHHYSAAPTTLASHTALMTGDHPHTHGVPRNDYKVNERNVMLQEILHDHGFTTAAFLGAMPLASHSNFTQGFDHVDETFTLHRATDGTGQSERPGDEVAKAVLDWLDAHPPGPDDRYLLFVHMFDAHAPYRPDPEELALYHPDPAIEDAGSVDHIERVQRMFAKKDPRAAAHAETLKELYLAGVATLDKHVGQLLDGLASRGTLDDALLIVTADHGETWDTHRERFDHGETVYDETIHTPLLVRFPGAWDAGDRVDAAVSNTDVAPTILALLGFDAPPTDGVSFAGALRWPLWDRGLPVFAEGTKPHLGDQQGWQNDPMEKAIIDADEKLILLPRSDRTELYDLADDPEELHNLHKERGIAALAEQLDAWRRGAHPLPSPRVTSGRVQAELAALGYAEPDDAAAPDDAATPDAPDAPPTDEAPEDDDPERRGGRRKRDRDP